jgi:hypothetical protein
VYTSGLFVEHMCKDNFLVSVFTFKREHCWFVCKALRGHDKSREYIERERDAKECIVLRAEEIGRLYRGRCSLLVAACSWCILYITQCSDGPFLPFFTVFLILFSSVVSINGKVCWDLSSWRAVWRSHCCSSKVVIAGKLLYSVAVGSILMAFTVFKISAI